MSGIRQYALVVFENYVDEEIKEQYEFSKDMPLIYLGEIPNMLGHGIFIGYQSGKIYAGYHMDSFRELGEDEDMF